MENLKFFKSFPVNNDSKPLILCFPHAGGNSEDYLKWQEFLELDATLMAMCLPGTGRRFSEKYPSSVESLTEEIAKNIDRSGINNYYLFGHSMGAILAYEVALKVRASPKGLIVSSSAAPAGVPSSRVLKMNAMSDQEFSKEILFFNGMEEGAITEELISFFLKKIRKDFELIGRYKYQPKNKLSIPIYSVVGDNDSHVSLEAITQWKKVTTTEYKNHIVPGNHFYFNENPELIASVIRDCISSENNSEIFHQSLII
ncbi:hypothetical protein AU509_11340 [Lonsdalea britannica]|uniref:Thioesterase n=1 Tax=Lonsdalea britannica TaxID=1082704 RepID=A0AAD0SDW2_9GAMM|nr:alpha/beta fold hydrolase [Lonsdalea britannica]AXW85674.1 thioesterase [Lonsdalea britannica]OSM96508.1 hypothetical protein AU509_11340 [Lonsdalea britannica]